MFSAGVGVGFQNCWSQSRFSKLLESVFKTAGVGVGFLKLLESESGVGKFAAITDSNQCLLNNLNYNINCLKIITGYWQY